MSKAFVLPVGIRPLGISQATIYFQAVMGDGVSPAQSVIGTSVFDPTLTPAQNLAAIKQAVVAQCAANGLVLTTAEVSVFTAIN